MCRGRSGRSIDARVDGPIDAIDAIDAIDRSRAPRDRV
jgi:hypothetical protein